MSACARPSYQRAMTGVVWPRGHTFSSPPGWRNGRGSGPNDDPALRYSLSDGNSFAYLGSSPLFSPTAARSEKQVRPRSERRAVTCGPAATIRLYSFSKLGRPHDAQRVLVDSTPRLIGWQNIEKRGATLTSRWQGFATDEPAEQPNLVDLAAVDRKSAYHDSAGGPIQELRGIAARE